MPAVVDRIASVSPSGAAPPRAPAAAPAAPTVTLEGGTSYTLDTQSPKTPHYVRMLGMLRQTCAVTVTR